MPASGKDTLHSTRKSCKATETCLLPIVIHNGPSPKSQVGREDSLLLLSVM